MLACCDLDATGTRVARAPWHIAPISGEVQSMQAAFPSLPVARPRIATLAALALGAACLPVTPCLAAPKTDIVVFQNGDRLTGEIKGLQRGQLELKTDNLGTVYIEWDKIATLETNQYVEVETSRGARRFGRIPEAPAPGSIDLVSGKGGQVQSLAMADVVRIAPIEQGSLPERLDGYLMVGFNYTKADNQTEFNLSGGLSSRNEVREWSLDGMATVNAQSTADTTSMYDITLGNRRFLENRWFGQFFATVQGNEELGLNIREVLGAGIGRYLMQDSHSEWSVGAGLAGTHEDFQSESSRNSLEAVLATSYSLFRYDEPKRSLDIGLSVFPSLTDAGRVRAEADIDSRYEIVKDLFFDVSLYASYDSDADPAAPSNYDYGLVTSLGYSF
jgi:hypothetical protein